MPSISALFESVVSVQRISESRVVPLTSFNMLRIMLLPLVALLFAISCMGQTFQYSHGWTNGKRAAGILNAGGAAHFHRDEDALPDVLELTDGDRRLEKCLFQLQNLPRNPLLLRAGYIGGYNNNNNLFGGRHQSNELYEELNGAETSDYAKH